MNIDRSLILGMALLAGLAVVVTSYVWVNREQEFRGTLVDCRDNMVPAVVGWPRISAKLITPGAWYALDFKNYPKWREFVDIAKGKQVVVVGSLRKWKGAYMKGHLRIIVTDMRLGP